MIVFVVNDTPGVSDARKIEHLPPSAKLVYAILKANHQMTQKDLIRETYLPPRTVRYALCRLKRENVLVERLHITDARQSLYGLRQGRPEVALEV